MLPLKCLAKLVTLSLLTLGIPSITSGQLRLAKVFQDHMVLQRNQPITVWGSSAKRKRISITFNGRTYTTRPDKQGNWSYTLPAMKASGPHLMRISSRKEAVMVSDILIGDLWVCSGQSNMEWTVSNSNEAEIEIGRANDDRIRHFKVPHSWASTPQDTLAGGDWTVVSKETVGNFTAVGYYFARELRKHVDVPIGLINTSWGGSRVEPWMHPQALSGYALPNLDSLQQAAKERNELKLQELERKHGKLAEKDQGVEMGWHQPDCNDSQWVKLELPGLWEEQGYEGVDGILWFRQTIELSEEEAAAGIELGLGKIDDSDWSYVNGHEVGSNVGAYAKLRVYKVQPEHLRAGANLIAIRVEDTGGGGGIYGDEASMYVKTVNGTRSLAGPWAMNIGEATFNAGAGFQVNHTPTILYNIMIHPLLKLPIKGALWYQGESNANQSGAYVYREQFADMIKDWRKRWKVGEFPFLFVQLANFMQPSPEPVPSNWAMLRESQSATLDLPNTAQAVIIDIGEANDIHPRNKQDVGLRLSLAARRLAYGEEDIVYSGPMFKEMKRDGQSIILSFEHVGSGLVAKDKYGYLKGFTIAGADQKFVWAKAQIRGSTIVVWSDKISDPKAVRYAWANNPDDANLYNEEGLPASPFRTDNWPE
ncbi:MAG: beta galactosidase jelly roll domain-containing protein [Saprospiraceae bacterium]|nr:beta galactosidase jelly roll domain-containing protein [Saprospiraceae bacterium]